MAEEQQVPRAAVEVAEVRQRLRVAAHDLRSLLGPVIGYADLIRFSSDLEFAKSHADRIVAAAIRIEEFADRLTEMELTPERSGQGRRHEGG